MVYRNSIDEIASLTIHMVHHFSLVAKHELAHLLVIDLSMISHLQKFGKPVLSQHLGKNILAQTGEREVLGHLLQKVSGVASEELSGTDDQVLLFHQFGQVCDCLKSSCTAEGKCRWHT